MTLPVQKHVLRFQVSVDDAIFVKMSERQNDLSCIEAGPIIREPNFIAQMEEELASIQKICDKVQRLWRLESEVELDDERMSNLLHDVTLDLRIIELIGPDNEIFLKRLHCIDLVCIFLLSHVDFAERSPAHDFHEIEIIDGQGIG